jgi:hypothetical protein
MQYLLSLFFSPILLQKDCIALQDTDELKVLRSWFLFTNCQCTLIELLRLNIFPLITIEFGQISKILKGMWQSNSTVAGLAVESFSKESDHVVATDSG